MEDADIPYFKTPFSVCNIIWKQCVVGPKYYKTQKDKSCMNDHLQGKKTRFRLQPTKKVGCPATMRITELKCSPEHTVTTSKNIHEIQAKMLANLKIKLQHKEDVFVKNWFYIIVSKLLAILIHRGHVF